MSIHVLQQEGLMAFPNQKLQVYGKLVQTLAPNLLIGILG